MLVNTLPAGLPLVAGENSTSWVAVADKHLACLIFPLVGCEWSVCLIAMSCGKYLAFRAPVPAATSCWVDGLLPWSH